MSERVIIIGGGFAGLSAGTALADAGYQVTVLEGRQVLGGRAYSFTDTQTGDPVDNGQHVFMGCYSETRALLKRIGTSESLHFQSNLSVDFAKAPDFRAQLRCWPLPAPWHLLSGLLRLSTLTWGDRWRLRHIPAALRHAATYPDQLDKLTVKEWLTKWHQSERIQRYFWDLIAIATLNENPGIASAAPFVAVLRQAFFEGMDYSRLGFSAVGLSDLYVHAARKFIEDHGGEVRLKAPVQSILLSAKGVEGVQLREGAKLSADWVISAVTAPALLKMLPPSALAAEPMFQRLQQLKPAPIVSIHLWFDRPLTRRAFVGMLDTQVQWVFNKSALLTSSDVRKADGRYISAVISGAHAFIDWTDNKLLSLALEELRRVFPRARKAALIRSLVIKEHHATLSPGVGCESLRPGNTTPYPGLLLAGDWTNTGLPATIESACVSGHACARLVTLGKPRVNGPLLKEVAHA